MTALQYALAYAFATSLHLPLIKRIKTGLQTGRQYVFINSACSWPLLLGLMLAEFALHHTVHVRMLRQSFGLPGPYGIGAHFLDVPLPYVDFALRVRWTFWVFAILTAWIQCAGLRRAVEAYGENELSLVAPMGALMPAFVGLFAWIFLGEQPTWLRMAGIGIIALGTYSIVADRGKGHGLRGWRFMSMGSFVNKRGLRIYFEARAIWVFFPLTLKAALNAVQPYSPYFVACITVGAMCLYSAPRKRLERQAVAVVIQDMLAGVRRGPEWGAFRPTAKHMVEVILRKETPYDRKLLGGKLAAAFCLSAVIVAIQQYLEFTSYVSTDVAVVSAIFKLDIPLAILWGVLFFQDTSPRRRLWSGLLMAFGVWLLR